MTKRLTRRIRGEDASGRVASAWSRRKAVRHLRLTALMILVVQIPTAVGAAPESAASSPAAATPAATTGPSGGAAEQRTFDAMEFEVRGATLLDRGEIEEAVYPYLGPARTADDVEQARAALEQTFRRKGYETVAVSIPRRDPSAGVIVLQVTEAKVGRLRVRGSRYHSLDQIKSEVPSLAEGQVPNLKEAEKELIAVNQQPDRRVYPVLRAGTTPGTVDVDLQVEDDLPLHGSIELNNRRSEDTKPLRLVTSLRYDNLWQLGHSISFGQEVAPERPSDAQVYSGSYLARFPQLPGVAFLVYGYTSDSDVATVGTTNVIGKGKAVGARVVKTLPGTDQFFHSVSGGLDYKDFDENVLLDGSETQSPVTYYPFTIGYSAGLSREKSSTNFGADVVLNFRGLGSGGEAYDNKRYEASDSFIYLRANADHTQTLPYDMALFTRFEGQISNGPLLSSEQLAVGGLDTVRGFLEAIVLGDYGVIGSVELRSPSVGKYIAQQVEDWRFHAFFDAATASIFQPLPGQQQTYSLASIGIGSRIKIFDALNGAIDLAFPVVSDGVNADDGQSVLFRVWGEL
jgi:Hemolysin activation/secretion protein